MKVVRLKAPASVANLRLLEEEPPCPRRAKCWCGCEQAHSTLTMISSCAVSFPAADGRVPLSDGAGEVVACGEGVTEFKRGRCRREHLLALLALGRNDCRDRRDIPGETVDGYAREYACMPAHAFTRAPAGYSHAQAATLPCAGVTAWRGLVVQGQVKPGDTVLVMGSGAVSLFALQFAKAAGARVIATSSSEEKLEKLTAARRRRSHQLQEHAELGRKSQGAHRRSRRRSRHRSRRSGDLRSVDGRVQARRTHCADRSAVGFRGRSVHGRRCSLDNPRQRNFDRQQGRSGRHDPRDPREPAEAGDRSQLSRSSRSPPRSSITRRKATSERSPSRSKPQAHDGSCLRFAGTSPPTSSLIARVTSQIDCVLDEATGAQRCLACSCILDGRAAARRRADRHLATPST